jgi:hypothetical protein
MAAWLKEAFGIVGGVIVAVGVVVYGLLATAYDKFYSELGLTPADVGTQYGKTLGGAAALTIVVGLGMGLAAWAFSAALLSEPFHGHKAQLAAFAIAVVLELVIVALAWSFFGVLMSLVLLAAFVLLDLGLLWAFHLDKAQLGAFSLVVVPEFAIVTLAAIFLGILTSLVLLAAFVLLDIGLRWGDPNQKWKTQVFAAAAAICVTWALLSVALDLLADAQADQVKRGGWVGPPQSGDLVFFSVRAMPTELEAATESAKDVAFVAERNDHKLLYLGASGGLLVIYDATAQEALFLPATQFRSPMLNCETAQLAYDERCWKYSKIGPGE